MIYDYGVPDFQKITYLDDLREQLPSIFNNSLSDAQRLASVIQVTNKMALIVGEMADNWNEVEDWIKTNGVENAVDGVLTKWKNDGTLTRILDETALPQINQKVDNLQLELKQAENRLNNSMSELETRINNSLNNAESSINASNKAMWERVQQEISNILTNGAITEVFENLSELKAKYPDGAKGIYLVTENKHLYYWNNTQWVDAGAYFQPELGEGVVKSENIADKTIQDINVGNIILDSILDTFAPIGTAFMWNDTSINSKIFLDKNNVAYTKNSDQTDSGIGFKVTLPDQATVGKPLYLHYLYYTVNADAFQDKVDIWIANSDNKLLKQIYTGSKSANAGTIEINAKMLADLNLTTEFNLIVAIHGSKGTLDVKNFRLNYTPSDDLLPTAISKIYKITSDQIKNLNTESLQNTLVDINNYYRWGGSNDNNVNVTTHDDWFEFTQVADGNCGINFPISNYTPGKDLYIDFESMISGAENVGEEIYLLDASGKLIADSNYKLNNNYNLTSKHFKYPAQKMRTWGITTSNLYLLFVTHKKGARMEVRNLNAGSTGGSPTPTGAINNIIATTPLRTTEKLGQEITDLNIGNFTPVKVTGLQYVTPTTPVHQDSVITAIEAYVTTSGKYTFARGKIDQNNLMVNVTHFTLDLTTGYNYLDIESKKITLNEGEHLFMLLDKDETLYQTKNPGTKHMPMLIQDTAHSSSDPNYPGYVMYDSGDKMIPFTYHVAEQSQGDAVKTLSDKVNSLNETVSGITINQGKLVLTRPDGVTVYLSVDNDNQLHANPTVPNKVAFIGNSLLFEGNYGSIGLAASDPDHDYYSLVTKWIKGKNAKATFTDRFSSAGWESATNSADRQAFFDNTIKPKITSDTDLVIIQLVDNVNTAEKLATFEKDGETLVKNIHAIAQNARILWVAGWFVDDNKLNLVKQICQATGAEFVDITAYKDDKQYQSYIGAKRKGIDGTEMTVTEQGVALHPGDLGMQKISEKIIQTISMKGNE